MPCYNNFFETYLNDYNEDLCVDHINGIKSDNRVENLEWVTNQENRDHMVLNGLASNQYTKKKHFEKIC